MNSPLDCRGEPATSSSRRVAIITGGSEGIGAGLVSAFRRTGYAVVTTLRSIGATDEDDFPHGEG
jgi:NAD(P)-dependent dehydrogenase (short-subunit alcohol dehydrogenase family)